MSFIRSCFNPRTHEECDNKINITIKILRCFNPRTHEECDFLKHSVCMGILDVSIHALTRSATAKSNQLICLLLVSIHALTRSATSQRRLSELPAMFQSTHSRGVRLSGFRLGQHISDSFNPRTHEECDSMLSLTDLATNVSIHALTRSATKSIIQNTLQWKVSIHALTRSATAYIFSFLFSDI